MVGNYYSVNINHSITYTIVSINTNTFHYKGDIL